MKKTKTLSAPLIDNLYEAVRAYVEGNGGKLVVIGGVDIMQDDPARKMNFGVVIRCSGRLPTFAEPQPVGTASKELGSP